MNLWCAWCGDPAFMTHDFPLEHEPYVFVCAPCHAGTMWVSYPRSVHIVKLLYTEPDS